MFDKYSKEAGKEQYLIPYFIAAHPGTRDQDMLDAVMAAVDRAGRLMATFRACANGPERCPPASSR